MAAEWAGKEPVQEAAAKPDSLGEGEEELAPTVEHGGPWEEAAVVTPGSSSVEAEAGVLLARRCDSVVQEEQRPSAPQ